MMCPLDNIYPYTQKTVYASDHEDEVAKLRKQLEEAENENERLKNNLAIKEEEGEEKEIDYDTAFDKEYDPLGDNISEEELAALIDLMGEEELEEVLSKLLFKDTVNEVDSAAIQMQKKKEGTLSWRDILITVFLAAVVLKVMLRIFFGAPANSSNHMISDADQHTRRKLLAALAEKRAKTGNKSGTVITVEKNTSDEKADGEEQQKMGKSFVDATTNDDGVAVESADIEEISMVDERNNTKVKNVVIKEEQSAESKEEEEANAKKKEEARMRHLDAIAKLVGAKQKKKMEQDRQPKEVPTITIYLILTASPSTPRLGLSGIPIDISPTSLLHCVAQRSGIPKTNIKLIFRGKVLNTKVNFTPRKNILEEYNIENESVLHVMGKPTSRIKLVMGKLTRKR